MRPHNLTLTMLGAACLWMGWYGFNVGSIVFADGYDEAQFLSETGRTFANTTLAAMTAILGWLLIERMISGKATTLGAASASWRASWPSPRPPARSTSVAPWPSA